MKSMTAVTIPKNWESKFKGGITSRSTSFSGCQEIMKDAVMVAGKDGKEKKIPADTVILCVGFTSNNENIMPFFTITPDVSMIGDLRRPATIRECEEEGL